MYKKHSRLYQELQAKRKEIRNENIWDAVLLLLVATSTAYALVHIINFIQ